MPRNKQECTPGQHSYRTGISDKCFVILSLCSTRRQSTSFRPLVSSDCHLSRVVTLRHSVSNCFAHISLSATMKASPSTSTASAPVAHNALPPPSTPSAGRSSRIAPHSHIKGLGLTPEGRAPLDGAGFIGQSNAREVRACHGMCSIWDSDLGRRVVLL